ncbi:hypothetical protein [Antarctobacter heliothermus]|uniref:Uncharacterized protein n=1 Tax=Antarctobacter heliothermus TaxID=74033 RepID=A0A239F2F4_9RHOB|nr:hypothetical protein [Antarctobacter heliothermus]SNS50728.1 hypothetical protein SAMN04488078_10182 [Antarctobacter heliothermus]
MSVDERAMIAARNNAGWYEAVFAAHGLRYVRRPFAFVGQDSAPPYHSNLTVFAPDQEEAIALELAGLASRFDRVVVKDSFCQLDLERNGFRALFEAFWIWRDPVQVDLPNGWDIVKDARGLQMWEDSWRQNSSPTDRRMFPDMLLEREDVLFLGRREAGRFTDGCIANLSNECVGLSNVFAENPTQERFEAAANAASWVGGHCSLVGYESGAELEHALSAGFQTVGRLRVLAATDAKF